MKSRYLRDVEKFIAGNGQADVGWPRVCRPASTGLTRTRMFVWGSLVINLPIRVAARITPELVSRWRRGDRPGCRWELGRLALGGLVGKAAPLAAHQGCDVHIAAAVPLPTPALIRKFLECQLFDSRHVVACPGPAPLSMELRFSDRCVTIVHPGVSGRAMPAVPRDLGESFDVVLADAGPVAGRRERLDSLLGSCRCGNRSALLGVFGMGDLTEAELRLLSRERCWLFLREADAREAAGRFAGDRVLPVLREVVAELKQRLAPGPRLVVTGRDSSVWLTNGEPEPRLVSARLAHNAIAGGAPYSLAVHTLLSVMRGLPDDAALRAAVEQIAGRMLPVKAADRRAPIVV
jgi:hypothetical protein